MIQILTKFRSFVLGGRSNLKGLTVLFSSLGNSDFGLPLHDQFSDFQEKAFFSDLLHIVKCMRYRFIEGRSLVFFPDFTHALLAKSDFKEIRISENVFTGSQNKSRRSIFLCDF
jgi:hypothetical protein